MSKKKGKAHEQATNETAAAVEEVAKPAEGVVAEEGGEPVEGAAGGSVEGVVAEEGGKPGEGLAAYDAAKPAGAEDPAEHAEAGLGEVHRTAVDGEEAGKPDGEEALIRSGAWAPGGSTEAARIAAGGIVGGEEAVKSARSGKIIVIDSKVDDDAVTVRLSGYVSKEDAEKFGIELTSKEAGRLVGFDAMTIPSTFTPVGGVDRTDGLSLIAAAADEVLGHTMRTRGADFDAVHDFLGGIAAIAQEVNWIGKALGGVAEIAAAMPAGNLSLQELRNEFGAHIERGERSKAMPAAFFLGMAILQTFGGRLIAAVKAEAMKGQHVEAYAGRRNVEALPAAGGLTVKELLDGAGVPPASDPVADEIGKADGLPFA